MPIVKLDGYLCNRCGYTWLPRRREDGVTLPKSCPNKKCKSPYWDTPRTRRTNHTRKRA